MSKLKISLLLSLLFFIGICLVNQKIFIKEIEIVDSEMGSLYKEYIITKPEGKIKLRDYFRNHEIYIKNKELKNIIDIQDNYEIIQLEDEICLTNSNGEKRVDGTQVRNYKTNYIFERNKKYGLLDKNLEILISPQYDGIFGASISQLLLVKKNGKYGYVDENGKIIIPLEYELGMTEKNGFMIVMKNNKIGVIDKKNRLVVDFLYDAIYYEKGNKFLVKKNNKYYFLDKNKNLEELDITWAGVQNKDKLFYEKDGKFGILSLEKGYITRNIYEQLSQNYKTLIIAMNNKKYGLIDGKGRIKLPFSYDFILPVGANYFKVGNDENGLVFLVDQKGRKITQDIYDDFIELNKENILAVKNNEMLILNQLGCNIGKIDEILNFNKNILLYKKNNKNILRKL